MNVIHNQLTASGAFDFFSTGTWTIVRNLAILFVAVFWLAVAVWVYKDARRRIEDPWLVAMATLIGLVPPFIGALVYLLLRPPEYLEEVTAEPDEDEEDGYDAYNGESGDELFDKAVAIVANERKVSTSYIQRRLMIGYNRAARLIERMEEDGMISKPNHQGKREILLPEGGSKR